MRKPIDFYFDFSSSYSYVALPRLDKLAQDHGLEVNWKPILLGVIFNAMNHAPPASDSVKGRYVWQDVQRTAELAGLPYKWPEPFPFNGITAARVFWHLADTDVDRAVEWARAVFHASFGEGRDCSNSEVLAAVATNLGLNAEEVLGATADDAVKARLKKVTGEAMERGVFGAPTFFVGDEMFWGGDRIDQLEHYVSGA
ncbi:MAG: 2-hydroxychromene-2-carboxylate isomerase [Gammaproteobacteria bacterium]|nr:2-hydroxychromene-2-carboxylate isomerase [Gammaproteobacteria bacterium]